MNFRTLELPPCCSSRSLTLPNRLSASVELPAFKKSSISISDKPLASRSNADLRATLSVKPVVFAGDSASELVRGRGRRTAPGRAENFELISLSHH